MYRDLCIYTHPYSSLIPMDFILLNPLMGYSHYLLMHLQFRIQQPIRWEEIMNVIYESYIYYSRYFNFCNDGLTHPSRPYLLGASNGLISFTSLSLNLLMPLHLPCSSYKYTCIRPMDQWIKIVYLGFSSLLPITWYKSKVILPWSDSFFDVTYCSIPLPLAKPSSHQ